MNTRSSCTQANHVHRFILCTGSSPKQVNPEHRFILNTDESCAQVHLENRSILYTGLSWIQVYPGYGFFLDAEENGWKRDKLVGPQLAHCGQKVANLDTTQWSFLLMLIHKYLQSCANAYIRLPFYEANLWVFPIAYHRLNMQLRSWPLLSK